MKIKVKRLNKNLDLPKIIKKGEYIDLCASCAYRMEAPMAKRLTKNNTRRKVMFDDGMIPLGIAMEIPKGFEAILVPRSSLFKRHSIIQTNSIGVIDHSFNSDQDEWRLPVVAFNDCLIEEGERICQFRIQLSQKATIWQKIKWLFSNSIKIVEVESLNNSVRGGFGSTGV